MKNDREFIDGIYEKAEIYMRAKENQENQKNQGHRTLKPGLVFVAVFALLLTTFAFRYKLNYTGIDQVPNITRSLPEHTAYLIDDVSVETIIEGTITNVEENFAILKVEEVYQGVIEESELEIRYELEGGNLFVVDEHVLLYLIEAPKNQWMLANGIYSKYSFLRKEKDGKLFQSVDHIILNTKDLVKPDIK